MEYNYNVFENSAYCPNYETAVKYCDMWIETGYHRYYEWAVNACEECLLSEYSDLMKANQKRIIRTWELLKARRES